MTKPLAGVAAKLEQLPRVVVEDALAKFKEIALAEVTKAIGSTTMHMHVRRGRRVPVKFDVSTNLSGSGALVNGYANGKPAAVWVWIEDGTKPHMEGKGRTLSAPTYDHPVKGPIHHPGTTGKQTWTKAIAEFRQQLPELALTDLRKAING